MFIIIYFLEDLMKMDELVDDDIMTTDIEKSALKVGCLFVCLLQRKDVMSGVHINVEKIKKIMDARMHLNFRLIAMRNQILDTCANHELQREENRRMTWYNGV
ncbi:uncharacterized protein LOC112467178 isoform X2 [Temnothorax curvispinosus]|uniref:Uncharacterized protein LOC112467178 isoform X2 n=1 Tax=Temnothorax curvispinosus TaxID=300111 RepID=A0A6J1R9S2_9HYME|nr:uncharacterized protein LOC112467178 isoform X2 [Temnothorax curvispinosus]